MSTLLHSADALLSLANGDDRALRQWAAHRLVVQRPDIGPDRYPATTTSGLLGDDGVQRALSSDDPIIRCLSLPFLREIGAIAPGSRHIATIRALLDSDHPPTRSYAAQLLAVVDTLSREELLRALSDTREPVERFELTLRTHPVTEAGKAVAAHIGPVQLEELFLALGCPDPLGCQQWIDGTGRPPEDAIEAVEWGAIAAGATVAQLEELGKALRRPVKGSQLNRLRKLVERLLSAAAPTPLVALIRGLLVSDRAREMDWTVPFAAGWARFAQSEADAIKALRSRSGERDARWLAEARAPFHETELETAGDLLLALLDGDTASKTAAAALLQRSPDLVIELPPRAHASLLARLWMEVPAGLTNLSLSTLQVAPALALAGTEETIGALVALPVEPDGSDVAQAYARALVNTGDRAVLSRLEPFLGSGLDAATHHLYGALFAL